MSGRSRASMGVSKTPGAIVLTLICLLARSRAATRVMPCTPALAAVYEVWPICPSKAATDAVSTIAPRSPSTGSARAIRAAAKPQDVTGADEVHADDLGEGIERARVAVLVQDP